MTQITTTPESKPDFLSRPLLSTISLDWEKAIYVAFILIAIISRFWGLGGRVMSHDESLHTQFSYQFYNGEGYTHTPLMHGPFLFHITAVSYWLFGDSDFSARIPVAIFGVILVAMPYLLRRWLGRVGALFASFILLVSPYITYYSRYIRHDIYVIVWALIVFIAAWYYLHEQKEKYLWWFAGGLALMFATKEVAFIYVAIFGSFIVLRLLTKLGAAPWFRKKLPALRTPILVTLIGVLLLGGGLIGMQLVTEETAAPATAETGESEGFAADPNADVTVPVTPAADRSPLLRWGQIIGVAILALGLFLGVRALRPQIDAFPEFDLVMLFTTLILPAASPLLTAMAGWNPRDYTLNTCMLEGQEAMSSLQLLFARMGNGICWSSFLQSGMVRSGSFLVLTLIVAVLVGIWWHNRRWLIAAGIFHAIFAVLFTSVFTNPGGWASGMIGSLGYWLEQQEVQRGSQPWFYYLFVTPFYEFLAVTFSLLAIRLWARRHKLNQIVSYWISLVLVSVLAYSLSNWLFNRSLTQIGEEPNNLPGILLGLLIFGAGVLFWYLVRRRQLVSRYNLQGNLTRLFDPETLIGFMPFLIWWLVLTLILYSYAGEKMPWLSTHFVIPMAFIVGWYLNERLKGLDREALFSRSAMLLWGLTAVLILAALLALAPLLLGQIRFGDQGLNNLTGIGRFLGSLAVTIGVFYLWRQVRDRTDATVRQPVVMLSVFGLLSLLTIRFTYMATFPNADYTNEFLVYAHGAPATKEIVLEQVEELSMRMHGDKSIKVAFDNDVSWPFTWYLRDYPNRVYFGENPSQSLTESPVILVGRLNWEKVEPYLGNQYEQRDYTFLWWPMEEYRHISWGAIFGDSSRENPRGLGDPGVRQALWDVFFYRDYTKYGEVFGGTYTAGEWPLRHDMRLYVRRDVLANLWDYGIGAVQAEGLQDPYQEGAIAAAPSLVLNEAGVPGVADDQFSAPRNVTVAADGRIFVADSGNHRIQVFAADGQFLQSWGGQGTAPGQFNEPWGLAVDDEYLYVADTWNHRIQKFTLNGELVTTFGQSGSPSQEDPALGFFFGPRSVVLLPDDQLLVTDTGNHRLQIAGRDGEFTAQLGNNGSPGILPGQFNEPVGLSRGPDGSVYLADTWNGRIQRFSPDLFPTTEWEVNAWEGQSINNKPYTAVDSAGRVYVTDPEGYRVLIFSSNGDYLGRFGAFGSDANSFGLPNGIAIDQFDNVYVADAVNNRILKFDPIFGAPPAAVPDDGDVDDSAADESPADEEDAADEEIDPTTDVDEQSE